MLADIAAYVVSEMDADTLYVMGSGSTVGAVMEEMGLENTLLGVDLVEDQALVLYLYRSFHSMPHLMTHDTCLNNREDC